MARFVEGDVLNLALNDLIRNADEYLYLISPYIKLHSRIKDTLKLKKSAYDLQIIVVFGKAEQGRSNRISDEDLAFLKEFPDLQIRYKKNLHAKYYASEEGALITSLNLYDFSQNNNIEVGVLMETPQTLVGRLTNWSQDRELDGQAFTYFNEVIDNSEILYKKTAVFEEGFLGFNKKYLRSDVIVDELDKFFNNPEGNDQKFLGFKSDYNNSNFQPFYAKKTKTGYCIRTGVVIPYNPERPYCVEAFRVWNQFGNENFPERYCHKTGKESNGKTCFKRPELQENVR